MTRADIFNLGSVVISVKSHLDEEQYNVLIGHAIWMIHASKNSPKSFNEEKFRERCLGSMAAQ